MMNIIEIVIALIVVGVFASFIAYINGMFFFIPSSIMVFVAFLIALNIVLFVINRK